MYRSYVFSAIVATLVGCGAGSPPVHRSQAAPSVRLPREAPDLTGISWSSGNLTHAQALAQRRVKPLLVYLYTSWCGPCKRLERDTFRDLAVIRKFDKSLVSYKLDGETPEGKRFRMKHRISSFPTFVFFDAKGREIDRRFGYRRASHLLRVVDDMLNGRNTVADYVQRLKVRPKDAALRFRLGMQLALRGESARAVTELQKVTVLDPNDRMRLASKALYVIARYVHFMKGRDLPAAVRGYKQLVQRYPASSAAAAGTMEMADALVQLKQPGRAIAALHGLMRAHADSAQLHLNAAIWASKSGVGMEQASGWARRACQLRKDGFPWWVLSQIRRRMGDPKGMVNALAEAVRRSPQNVRYRRALDRARQR